MRKSPILVLTAGLLIITGCQQRQQTSQETSHTSDQVTTSEEKTTTSQTTTATSQNQTTSSMNQNAAIALFKEALKKDYSNLTIYEKSAYVDDWLGESITYETYEYLDDGYNVVYDYSLNTQGYEREQCLSYYYVDDKGVNYQYFAKEEQVTNSKAGWISKGYKNAEVSIANNNFYLPLFLEKVTENDVKYQNGEYILNDTLTQELNSTLFKYAWENDIVEIGVTLSSSGYIEGITGYCEDYMGAISNDTYVYVELFDFNQTSLPSEFSQILPFSEDTKIGYWENQGWSQDYQQAYYTEAHVKLSENQEVESDETYKAIIDVDKKFDVEYSLVPTTFSPWDLVDDEDKVVTWHYDETILEKVNPTTSGAQRVGFRGILGGETEIYVSVNGKDGVIESEHIKVKVNGLQEQDKQDAVYDFDFVTLSEDVVDEKKTVTAVNKVSDAKAPYEIKVGPGASTNSGSNASYSKVEDPKYYYESSKSYLLFNPSSQETMNKTTKTGLYFDFKEQQVSELSFKYGMFFEQHLANLKQLTKVVIRTSNDGEEPVEKDITEEITTNISAEFVKVFTTTFDPASKVEIIFESNWIGGNLSFVVDSCCFKANDDCSMYVPPEDIEVSEVQLVASSQSVYVGKSVRLTPVITPQNAYNKDLVWHVEEGKEDYVSIDEKEGLVTGLQEGTVKVWVTAANGVKSNEVELTISTLPDLTTYVGNIYLNEDKKVTILDAQKVKYQDGDVTIEANVQDFANDRYILTNEQGEGFNLSFASSRVDVSNIKHLVDGTLQSSTATYSLDLAKRISSFTLKMQNQTVDTSKTYEVLEGETRYITIETSPSDANVSLSFTSSSDTNATVQNISYGYTKQCQVDFKEAGEVTITITLKDEYEQELTKQVKFLVKTKVYVNDTNWSIKTLDGSDPQQEYPADNNVQLTYKCDDLVNVLPTVSEVTWDIGDGHLTSKEDITTREIATISKNYVTGVATINPQSLAGEVSVFCSITANGQTFTKVVYLQFKAVEEGALPSYITGQWAGADISGFEFTFTIDGTTATLENENGSLTFTYEKTDSESNNIYTFVSDDDPSCKIEFYYKSSDEGNIEVIDLNDKIYTDLSLYFYDPVDLTRVD